MAVAGEGQAVLNVARLHSDKCWPWGPQQSPLLFLHGLWMGCVVRALTVMGKQGA